MTLTITADLVESYSLCPRKAFLLISGEPNAERHEYLQILDEQAAANGRIHRAGIENPGELLPGGATDLTAGAKVFADVDLAANGLRARCDFLKRVNESSGLGRFGYEPVKVVGTRRASRPDVLGLVHQGLVLGEVQGRQPAVGTLVLLGNRSTKVKLSGKHKDVRRIVKALQSWTNPPVGDTPPIILNKHCPICPFRNACRQQAEKEDNLSLLDRMTPKQIRKYHDKGIFTVRQLSHIYKPRRSRKKAGRPVKHSLELQALAIRTGKIHVDHLPELTRKPVELYLDMEGIPERDFHYLAGLLVCRGGAAEYESFWAHDDEGEAAMWSALISRLAAFPDSPVYHYGNYEKKAFATLEQRHGIGSGLNGRLVNVASSVFGRVYFPVFSNGLKSLGRFLGFSWTDPQASGLQSLVWRHRWEKGREEPFRNSLLLYNREDCEAVRLLVDRLVKIGRDAATDPAIEFANRPKRHATETGVEIHAQFERILGSAEDGAQGRAMRVRRLDTGECEPKKRGGRKGHQAYGRIVPSKANRVVTVQSKRMCPRGHGKLVPDANAMAERTIIDLVFTRNGCRKTVTRYQGKWARCPKCSTRVYGPPALTRMGQGHFGHSFQAWVVYQRVILRLPYRIIVQVTEHLFGIGLSESSVIKFLQNLSRFYAPTEEANLQAILKSPFVHLDETKINIQGVNNYVWVFTDGTHVVFRMTKTREADIVHKILAGYKGVLISDFYPGYDSLPCRQQKCLVHLIRDINDDLWKAPFDKELEAFAAAVQALLVPILAEVDRFGLKACHLRKFQRCVDRFYGKHVIGREYHSESVSTFQKRFDRYRDGLFTFLTEDGIPWENNMAERAIRQLAIQRKISGSFFERVAEQYLLLLAIAQTCRFQGKSFLKFLLSRQTDLDSFRKTRPIKYSRAVAKRESRPADNAAGESPLTDGRDSDKAAGYRGS